MKFLAFCCVSVLALGCSVPCGVRTACEQTCHDTAEICSPEDFDTDACMTECQADDLTAEEVEMRRECAECYVERTQCNPMYLSEFCLEECT